MSKMTTVLNYYTIIRKISHIKCIAIKISFTFFILRLINAKTVWEAIIFILFKSLALNK